MPGKKSKKVEEDLIPEEMVPVESETAEAVSPERDFDAEQKDAEVMKDEDIPPANADKMWRYLSPKNVLAADSELILRFHVLLDALKGYGISQNLFDNLPADMQTLFHEELLLSENWTPGDNL